MSTAPGPREADGAARSRDQRRGLLIGYACAGVSAVLFSTKGIVIKLAYAEGTNAETLLALRMALSVPVYLAVGLVTLGRDRRTGRLPEGRLVLRAAGVGLLGYWISSYADFLGLEYISAQFERLILYTYPALVVLFGSLLFGQPIRARALVGIGITYAGLILVFATESRDLGADAAVGAGLVMIAAVCFAFYQLLAKGTVARMSAPLFTCVAMTSAGIAVLAQFPLMQPISALEVGPTLLGYGVLLAIGSTILPSFLLSASLQRISAQANSAISTLSPVVTILLAAAILGEALTAVEIGGAALVIAGVAWFTLFDRKG